MQNKNLNSVTILFGLSIIMVSLFISCSNLEPSITITIPPTLVMTFTRSTQPSLTFSPIFPTPLNTVTIFPSPAKTLSPSPTSTFDAASIQTQTPEIPAQCPIENPNIVSTITPPDKLCLDIQPQVLEYLNAGGNPDTLVNDFDATKIDLTNDSIPEITIAECSLRVYSCVNSKYETILDMSGRDGLNQLLAVKDMNLDGVPELIVGGNETWVNNSPIMYYRILEWDGHQFQSLINHPDFQAYYGDGGIIDGWIYTEGVGQKGSIWDDMSLQDIDGNGTIEFILNTGLPATWDRMLNGGPARLQTYTYMWNGTEFNLESMQVAPPNFRFQAVQDADYASISGDYPRAFELYQEVISSNNLDWWSSERYVNYKDTIMASISGEPTPTPLPIDNTEHAIFAAYAYYRMMLLHIIKGNQSEASNNYNMLIHNYKPEDPGYPFVEMATSFWMEFSSSHDIEKACASAIDYADRNKSSTLKFLGSEYHGWLSHFYKPEDICPFR